MKREQGLQMIAVEMHFATADRYGYLGPRSMTLRVPLPIRSALYEVESVEYSPDGSIIKVERGTLEQLIDTLQKAKEAGDGKADEGNAGRGAGAQGAEA